VTTAVVPLHQPDAITRAVTALRAGELIIIPTDTVYGVATLPEGLDGLHERVYGNREISPWPALPFLLTDEEILPRLARPNRAAERLAHYFWPGKVTLLLPAAPDVPFPIENTRVALRVPDYPPIIPLLRRMGGFLIVGRAARSGYPSSITAQEALAQLGEEVALILDGGPSPFGITSTVVDCIEVPPQIVQRGAVSEARIQAALEGQETRS
jgi:tRNA threonylcarbamoyl adenosine modification protein (Sua5/YciO/YrdC/YwlC family)